MCILIELTRRVIFIALLYGVMTDDVIWHGKKKLVIIRTRVAVEYRGPIFVRRYQYSVGKMFCNNKTATFVKDPVLTISNNNTAFIFV